MVIGFFSMVYLKDSKYTDDYFIEYPQVYMKIVKNNNNFFY